VRVCVVLAADLEGPLPVPRVVGVRRRVVDLVAQIDRPLVLEFA